MVHIMDAENVTNISDRKPIDVPEHDDLFSIIARENPFRNLWYAVAPIDEMPTDVPYGIELFNTQLVLFYDKHEKKWNCVHDRCAHRCSSLSSGFISTEGKIECHYHGWQYDGEGYCTKLPGPMVKDGAPNRVGKWKIPAFAVCVYKKILWVFAGEMEDADTNLLPPLPYDEDKIFLSIFVRDTEFDWLIYNEHNLDQSHIKFSHRKTLFFAAKPIGLAERIEDWTTNPEFNGFRMTQDIANPDNIVRESELIWHAPSNCVVIEPNGKDGVFFSVTPLGYGRCRVLFGRFSDYWAFRVLPIPDTIFHILFARVTEEDAIVVRSQMKQLSLVDSLPVDLFIDTPQDIAVSHYRKWLKDKGGYFWQRQLNTKQRQDLSSIAVQARAVAGPSKSIYERWFGNLHLIPREIQHLRICRTCSRSVKRLSYLEKISLVVGAAFFISMVLPSGLGVSGLTVSGIALSAALYFFSRWYKEMLYGKRF